MSEKKRDPFKKVTPIFRGSYVWALKPRPVSEKDKEKGKKPQYQTCIVLDKDDSFWEWIEKMTPKAAKEKWGKVPKKLKTTVRDGDDQDCDEGKEKEEFLGSYMINATSYDKPGIVDSHGDPIMEPGMIYSGAWYRASVRLGAWFHQETNQKGVSLYLDNLMRVPTPDGESDESFGGKQTAAADFADYVDDDEDDDPAS